MSKLPGLEKAISKIKDDHGLTGDEEAYISCY